MLGELLKDIVDREDEGSMFVDADSILWSSCYLYRDSWNIELAYMNVIERIGNIRTECYNQVIKLNELLIGLTSKTNFRYTLYSDYKATRSNNESEDNKLLRERVSLLKRLVYERLKPIVRISSVFEADDLLIQYADKGYITASLDKDCINASPTKCFNYKTNKWNKANSQEDINRWYLIQSIAGDVSDNIKGCKGMGMVKATKFVDELLNQEKTYNDYINLFDTNEDCLLSNRLVRLNQYDSNGNLKLIGIEEVIESIIPF